MAGKIARRLKIAPQSYLPPINDNLIIMKFDTQPRPKKEATAVVWYTTVTVMNNLGEMQSFSFEVTNYDALLEKLERNKQIIDNNYQFRVREEPMPF